MSDDVDVRVRIHAALADPVRLAIVDELTVSDRSPVELRSALGIESNLLAHHLGVLEDAGLVARSASHGDRRRRYVRLVAGRLSALAVPHVLRAAGVVFVCTANSARSQLAAALWNAASAVPATSAGTEPAASVHPGAVDAARRRGLDLSAAVPRPYEDEDVGDVLVVTVCDVAHEQLAARERTSGRRALHWSTPDPAQSGDPAPFDTAADSLAARVGLLGPMVVPA